MYSFSKEFEQFISSDCQRGEFIQEYLKNFGIDAPAINLNGKRHIYVKFPSSQYDKKYNIKTVLAHYDRVDGSPGANDNSSSVFLLMEWAVRLSRIEGTHNIRLIFTDGEELGAEGVKSQGAFDLGVLFKRLGIINDDIFVFDCMGRGSVPVICQTKIPKSASDNFINRYKELELRCERILTSAVGQYVKLPSNYSDNAGFIANGIPAIAITMLPFEEIVLYKQGLSKLLELSVNGEKISSDVLKDYLPKTWSMLHTKADDLAHLNQVAFELTEKILNFIAKLNVKMK